MNCFFCGGNFMLTKVRMKGKEGGKPRQKTANICLNCSAMADDRQLEEILGWDEGTLRFVETGGKQ